MNNEHHDRHGMPLGDEGSDTKQSPTKKGIRIKYLIFVGFTTLYLSVSILRDTVTVTTSIVENTAGTRKNLTTSESSITSPSKEHFSPFQIETRESDGNPLEQQPAKEEVVAAKNTSLVETRPEQSTPAEANETTAKAESVGSKPKSTTNDEERTKKLDTQLPTYMVDYFKWHREQVASLNQDNWKEKRFLVSRCLVKDNVCGGASDRLQSLPALILIASMTKRILFYKWTRPAALEEFLVPPVGGLNWTVPEWLEGNLNYTNAPMSRGNGPRDIWTIKSSKILVTIRHQNHDHGRTFYDQNSMNSNQSSFEEVYREVWDRVFTPSPAVASLIKEQSEMLHLKPGKYVATHIRSKYTRDKSGNGWLVSNALNCASQTFYENFTEPTIYVSTDSTETTNKALAYGRSQNVTIIARNTTGLPEPFHLDRAGSYFTRSPSERSQTKASDYYDTFVDLYLMSNSACVTYGVGGFGKWAAMLSRGGDCTNMRHYKQQCAWKALPSRQPSTATR